MPLRLLRRWASPTPVTLAAFAAHWSRLDTLRPSTRRLYRHWLDAVWCPALGSSPLAAITRHDVLEAIDAGRARHLQPGTLKSMLGVLRALLADARDEGLVLTNVATSLGRQCGRVESRATALTAAELATFLEAASLHRPHEWSLFLTLARAGLRVGEALALTPASVDLVGRSLAVVATCYRDGTIAEAPKTARSRRRVDCSHQLVAALSPLVARGRPWLFGSWEKPMPYHAVGRAFAVVRDAVGLSRHVTPHTLRHTFASLLMSKGESPAYVQAMLGHASVRLTIDLYGHHLPHRDLAAVDGLDE